MIAAIVIVAIVVVAIVVVESVRIHRLAFRRYPSSQAELRTVTAMPTLTMTHYGVETIQDEARRLLKIGAVRKSETIGHLQSFFPAREWQGIAEELELQDYRFNDPICDLIGCEEWSED